MISRTLHTAKGRAVVANFLLAHGGLLACGLFLLAGLGLTGSYGLGVDELIQRDTATSNLRYILGQADRVDTPAPHDRWYGVSFELPLLLAEGALGLEDYYYVHRFRLTVTHLFYVAGGFFCYLLAYRLFNNRLIALFALLLFLLHPRIYAHSFFNSKDLPFLSMFVVALYLTERAFRKDTAGAFLLLGIAVGIATNLRIMGVMLFLAVVGMRALDLALAKGWGERKRILATVGLFAAAAGLTWYGLGPNAWSVPLEQLTGSLSLTTDHPTVGRNLFQGEVFRSDELPAHYGLTWFAITTPPVLLLGVVGMAAVLARGFSRPGMVWGKERLRFWWLLLGCFGLPLLGVTLAGSNTYSEWRQLYFIYVPFVLLAAGGLYWVVGALSVLRWRWAGVYGLTGLGLGLTLLQMAQLHPWQHLYFNFLVDRSGPGEPKARYQLEYFGIAQDGFRYLLARHPDEQLAVYAELRYWGPLLPPDERRRLRFNSPAHEPDYALESPIVWSDESHRPDLAFNSQYFPVYNSFILSLRALDGSRMDTAAVAGYEEIYRSVAAGEPIIRGEYDLYLEGRQLTFVKEECQPGERAGQFGVKVYRAAGSAGPRFIPDTSAYRYFDNTGVRLGDRCLAVLQLPDYPIAYLVVGRYTSYESDRAIWEALYSFTPPGLEERVAGLWAGRGAVKTGAGFELYRQDGRLIYYRENCAARDAMARVFLRVTPEDVRDLRPERREFGFEVRDFHFGRHGLSFDGQCLATVTLPDYPIAGIRTGQDEHWEFRGYPPVDMGFLREQAAALTRVAADFRGEFDLYWRDNILIYRREGCTDGDTAAGFFLHIMPVDGADLAVERREYGFESRDFEFARWGGHFGGRCLAAVPLPGYAIAGVRTGQYVAGQGELWSAELETPESPASLPPGVGDRGVRLRRAAGYNLP